MAVLTEELPLSCVKVRLEVPVSKIYPQGRTREVVLYGKVKNDCVDDFEYLSILLQRARA